ncbi:MAG: DNA repair protein RadA [Deltaproteobacteria bacterium]|nr:DNA repair protein RadA [Deltaproteobacteria bacterium]
MGKVRLVYVCQSCGFSAPKWLGKCPECMEWNSIVEQRAERTKKRGLRVIETGKGPLSLTEVRTSPEARSRTGVGEFDRTLGGGMVPGSAILIGGDPGVGKSTLLLQTLSAYADKGKTVLYVSGEESARQIRLRAERLGTLPEDLFVWAETSLETIVEEIRERKPDVVIIDSVQTIFSDALESTPGSVGQVREISARLISLVKGMDVVLFLVGHVTKDGAIAGPKVLEHMVDTVLYFEGETAGAFKILRAVKNRFGSVMEIGVFEMGDSGLTEVKNPSEFFLRDRPIDTPGSCVAPSQEGTRTLLVEVQSLVSHTVFGTPRRTIVGVDYNKVILIIAVLEKKASLLFADQDVFLKTAGGLRVDEPAIDLAVAASLASNLLDKAIPPNTIVFGEIGLSGEVRSITRTEQRLLEAKKLGFTRAVLPKESLRAAPKIKGIKLVGVSNVREAVEVLFDE